MSIPRRHSDPHRVATGERTFFVTTSTWGKTNLLQSARAAELFIQTLCEYRVQGKYRLHAFVVMPNHFHVLLTLGKDVTVERAMQFIKGGFSFRAGRELGIRTPFWQKGFSEIRVLDSETFEDQRRYIHNHPVEAHLVEDPRQYPYSSATSTDLDPIPQKLMPIFLEDLYGMRA
jgi:REP-associated tyrosine transposase